MTMREEVLVMMGADASAIERGLGVGRSHFNDYLNYIKTEEGKYSSWWNTELKKREEAEVAASVRAASRSIQARRLLRQREAARGLAADAEQAAANTVIAGGSLPAGWAERAAAQKAARELEMKAAGALKDAAGHAHGASGAMRELMVVVRELARGDVTRLPGSLSRLLGMIGLSTSGLLGVAAAAAEAGAVLYEVYQTRKAVKEEEQSQTRMDAGAKIMAVKLRQDIANFEKVGKLNHETAERYQKILSAPTLERNRVVVDALRKLGGPVTKHDAEAEARADEEHAKNVARYAREDMNAQENLIMSGFKVLEIKGEMAKLDRTGIEYKKKQLELDEAQRNLLLDQKRFTEEKAALQTKINEEQRVFEQAQLRIKDINQKEREKFMPTLEELAHHGRFGGQARSIGRLERRIKRDYERGDLGGADRDIASRNKIYDSLADRGVVAERTSLREIQKLNDEMRLHLKAIATGKAELKVKFGLK
jgi:hypothetical protein